MTGADGGGQDLNRLLLEFLGAFAHLQHVMDHLSRYHFEDRIPGAADLVIRRVVRRISDEERQLLFQAIAVDVESDAELSNFKAVYNDVKGLRDNVAHAAKVTAISEDSLDLTPRFLPSLKEHLPPGHVTVERHELAVSLNKCHWMTAQVMYVADSGGFLDAGRRGLQGPGTVFRLPRISKPSADPAGWVPEPPPGFSQ